MSAKRIIFLGMVLLFFASILEVPIWKLWHRFHKPPQRHQANAMQKLEFYSKDFVISQTYGPFEAPLDEKQWTLLSDEKPQTLWIRGFSVVPVSPDGKMLLPKEFLYYANLDFLDYNFHRQIFRSRPIGSHRLFAVFEGHEKIQFPKGYGIPVLSNEFLRFNVIPLNLNAKNQTVRLKFKIEIDFVRDADLAQPLKPLFVATAGGMKLLLGRDGYYGIEKVDPVVQEARSLSGIHALDDGRYTVGDSFGRKFSFYWVLKPGKEMNPTLVTQLLNLPFDTTLHYADAHLYPYAESLELKDLTAGQTILELSAKPLEKGLGLLQIEHFTSEAGVPLYKGHEYEVITTYLNTSGVDQKAMATLFLYLEDKDLQSPNHR